MVKYVTLAIRDVTFAIALRIPPENNYLYESAHRTPPRLMVVPTVEQAPGIIKTNI